MTKKDFRLIADALRTAKPCDEKRLLRADIQRTAWLRCVDEVCEALESDNPRFDPDRFKAACGV